MSKSDSRIMFRLRFRFVPSFLGLWIFGVAVIPCFGQLIYQQIKVLPAGQIPDSQAPDPSMGELPMGQLIEGNDGKLYGTMSGPSFLGGTVFQVNKDGSRFVALWRFGSAPTDGSNSWAGLVQASDGSFYGTTFFGGSNDLGTVFRLSSAGNGGYTNKILKNFTGINGDGANPACKLTLGTDGFLYGTTVNGGTNNIGTIFKLLPA